jgi:glycosyltransferase involved in cell wall biosynthesis
MSFSAPETPDHDRPDPERPDLAPAPADVSIVLCTRDRPEMLRAALESIARATARGVEVIVVDSASATAKTRTVARAAGARYVRSDIKGLSIARNIGIRHSSRDILVFTDDDCMATPAWIETLTAHFADPAVGAATGLLLDHHLVGDGPTPQARTFSRRTREGLDAGHGALMAFRRSLLTGDFGFDHVLGAGRRLAGAEDLDIFCRLIARGHSIVHDPSAVIHHMNTRSDADYRQLLHGYGLGLGALCNKWFRRRLPTGVTITIVLTGRTLVRTLRHIRSARRRRGELAMLGGIVAGFMSATRLRLDGERFVDAAPPVPTTIPDAGHAVAA